MWSSYYLLASALFASAISDVVVEDIELSNFLEEGSSISSSAAGSAARWLFEQRQQDGGWGPFTPRAVVALALAERAGAYSLPKVEWDLLAKQLNIFISMEVGRDANQQRPLGVSRLSHFVNALYATCQEPRRFHGLDLVRRLRDDTDRQVRLSGDAFSFPLVYVTLCLAGEATHQDLTRLARMYQLSANRTDVQALQLLAMSCITALPTLSSFRPTFASYLRDFSLHFRTALHHNTTDVYTKALAMQTLNSPIEDPSLGVSSLLADQLEDGSFERSLLATYHAIPALLRTSLLALRDAHCPTSAATQGAGRLEAFPQPSRGVVHLSLWVGEGAEKDVHTVTVSLGANDTLLQVMRIAMERNHIFRFSADETSKGVRVYSLAGIPNDSERQTSWQLYVQKVGQHERLRPIKNQSVDKVFPPTDAHMVFWYKRTVP